MHVQQIKDFLLNCNPKSGIALFAGFNEPDLLVDLFSGLDEKLTSTVFESTEYLADLAWALSNVTVIRKEIFNERCDGVPGFLTKNKKISIRRPKLMIYSRVEKVETIVLDDFCRDNQIEKTFIVVVSCRGTEDLVLSASQHILQSTEYLLLCFNDILHYDDQKKLEDLLRMLPGTWIRRTFSQDPNYTHSLILLENQTYREKLLSPTGAWTSLNENDHVFDHKLAVSIIDHYGKGIGVQTILDMGCGNGAYSMFFINEAGYKVKAIDGNPNTPELTQGIGSVQDFTVPFDLGIHDLVLCLEVAEHIPAEFEAEFVKNLARHTGKHLVLSWGIPGQDGLGHVNCRENKYVIDLITSHGFVYMENISLDLRTNAENTWFKNTILAFEKI
jgi:SAM-dependent methyltransferase